MRLSVTTLAKWSDIDTSPRYYLASHRDPLLKTLAKHFNTLMGTSKYVPTCEDDVRRKTLKRLFISEHNFALFRRMFPDTKLGYYIGTIYSDDWIALHWLRRFSIDRHVYVTSSHDYLLSHEQPYLNTY